MITPYFCACGSEDGLENHHLLPRSLGGTDCETNLITLCGDCHGRIHGMVRRDISALTRAGIATRKAQGVKFGNPRPAESLAKGKATRIARANAGKARVREIIREIQSGGVTTLRGIADALNARGVSTARGSAWSATQVAPVLAA